MNTEDTEGSGTEFTEKKAIGFRDQPTVLEPRPPVSYFVD
jgi:hypothetical protein